MRSICQAVESCLDSYTSTADLMGWFLNYNSEDVLRVDSPEQ